VYAKKRVKRNGKKEMEERAQITVFNVLLELAGVH